MKKIICILAALCLICTGCGQENTLVTEVARSEGEEETESETAAYENTEYADEPFDFVFTLPPGYIGKTSQKDLDKAAEENGYHSIILNADGSVTYTMTESQHEKLMRGIKKTIADSLDGMLDGETYPNFTDVEPNEDYTSFTVITKGESLDYTEQYSVKLLYRCGEMYNDYNGTPVDNVHVDYVNKDSGEIIAYADSAAS